VRTKILALGLAPSLSQGICETVAALDVKDLTNGNDDYKNKKKRRNLMKEYGRRQRRLDLINLKNN